VTGFLILHRVWLQLVKYDSQAAGLVDGLRSDLAQHLAAFYVSGEVGLSCSLMWAALFADTRKLYGDPA
jgi:hypothetical protein